MGRPDEAIPQAERAQELDPLEPLFRALYAVHLTFVRRYDDAIAEFRKADKTAPNQAFALNIFTEALHHNRMYEEALDAQRRYFASIDYGEGEEALTRGYAEAGYTGAMRRAADALAARALSTQIGAKITASLYARAGEHELTLEWLERAFANHDQGLAYIRWPVFDSVRDDPRYQDLLRRMNLPQ